MPRSRATTLAQLAVLPPEQENRQFRRRLVNLAAVLEDAGVSLEVVHIKDLSERGCRVSTEGKWKKDAALILKLPGVEALRARVVWCDGTEAGCAFEQELPKGAVDNFLGNETETRTFARSVFGQKDACPSVTNSNADRSTPPPGMHREKDLQHPSRWSETAPRQQVWIVASVGHLEAAQAASVSDAYRKGIKRHLVDVVSISSAGAKICTMEPVQTGATFWIKLPNLEPVQMSVVWAKGLEAGCQFLQPLDPAIFRVVAQAVRR